MAFNRIKIPVIYHGKGTLKELKSFRHQRIFIVTDKTIWELFGKKISKYFKKQEIMVFDEVEPDPTDTIITKGGDLAREFKPDLILGIGGGSVLDAAKGIFFLYEREDKTLYDMSPFTFFKLGKKSKFALIPTTSGTGSENTWGIVVTKTGTGQKVPLGSYEVIPSTVILDPNLPLGMPPKLTAETGIDALVHAVEAEINALNNDFTEALNLHAIKLLFKYLPVAVQDGSNEEARQKVHNAASLAGIGFANSSCGIAHSCGHSLGGVFHFSHGISVGVMLPYILEFNKPECENKYIDILEALNVTDSKDPTAQLVMMVKDLLKTVNLPTSLKEIISEADWKKNFEKLIEFVVTDQLNAFNPRAAEEEDFRKIFQYAYEEKSVDW
ncbi:MAG: iron-containing alcohol dehydrogenase [Candidatus Helarchaeota archaeon]|nr:iron-containing alcohol dehydrogenase [Candidatus Helarchaeota archaeon]